MIYNLSNAKDIAIVNTKIAILKSKGAMIELVEKKGSRTLRQNNAIHLYCEQIAELLNELGWEFRFIGLKGLEIEIKYTKDIVKSTIWKPIQIAMFKKESTAKLTKIEVSEIAEQIERHFAITEGIDIPFPSINNI